MTTNFAEHDFDSRAFAVATEAVLGVRARKGWKLIFTRRKRILSEAYSWVNKAYGRSDSGTYPSYDEVARAHRYIRRILEGHAISYIDRREPGQGA